MRYWKTLCVCEHYFKFFFQKKVCAHKRHKGKNFPYFCSFFFKIVPDVIHTFLRLPVMYRVPNGSKEACISFRRLNFQSMVFYGCLYRHIGKKAFFIHKNKGFQPKSSNFKKNQYFCAEHF